MPAPDTAERLSDEWCDRIIDQHEHCPPEVYVARAFTCGELISLCAQAKSANALRGELAAARAALRDAFAPTNTDPWSAYSLWTEKHAAAIEAARGKP